MAEATDTILRKTIAVSRVNTDPELQARVAIDPAEVEKHRATIKEHGVVDALVVFCEEGEEPARAALILADGWHRLEAYVKEKVERIPVEIRVAKNARSAALLFGIQRNGHHGVPLNTESKIRAAKLLVNDPIHGKKTDKVLAFQIGCSVAIVAAARRGETAEDVKVNRKKKAEKKKAETVNVPSPPPSPSEKESAAPPPVVAHERKDKEDPKLPTKAGILRQMRDYINNDVIDEKDVIDLMASATGEYRWVPKPGCQTHLTIIGKTGKIQIEAAPVIVKEIGSELIILKYEDGDIGDLVEE